MYIKLKLLLQIAVHTTMDSVSLKNRQYTMTIKYYSCMGLETNFDEMIRQTILSLVKEIDCIWTCDFKLTSTCVNNKYFVKAALMFSGTSSGIL